MAADNVFPDEITDFFVCDLSVGFSFDPFGEVISEDENETLLAGAGKGSDDIHCPSHKRVRRGRRS